MPYRDNVATDTPTSGPETMSNNRPPAEPPRADSPVPMEILRKFRIIIGAVRQHSRELETAFGVGGAQVWMLAAIAETPDISVSQLGKALSIHVSTASNLLDKLARRGLVDRLRSDDDRRAVRLRVTPAGQAILDRAPQPLTGLMIDALRKMPRESLDRLDEDLACLIGHLKSTDPAAANEPL